MTRKVGVIGGGAWGTALAQTLARNGHEVTLWFYEADLAAETAETGINRVYLPEVKLAENVTPTSDLEQTVASACMVVSASPSQVARNVISNAAPLLKPGVPVVSVSKGIELKTLKLMHQTLGEVLPDGVEFATLSGPSFAAEVVRGVPTAVSLACRNQMVAKEVQTLFNGPTFRVYTLTDVVGVEVGGALKNVIALASGISDGLSFGHNSRAALITRGLSELSRLGVAMGAEPITFLGLSGLGDLVLTATGDLSRNRTVGMRLGKGEKIDDIIGSMTAVAEGVKTCPAAVELANRLNVEMPIASAVLRILSEETSPQEAVVELMGRPAKDEFADLESRG